mgnify:CR=1 FL=1
MIWFWIVLFLFLFFFLIPTFCMSVALYRVILVRTKPKKWGRECSMPDDPIQAEMFEKGLLWAKENESAKKEVSVQSDGLRLCGEYFDFGSDKAVIIIPGRMESLLYSYFFAKPYKDSGYNVLVIDNRAHGLSEGKHSTLGFKEKNDILAWGKLLHSRFSVKEIVLHGICIGASTGLFALTDPDCPDYFTAFVAEGMYTTFYHTFVNHMKSGKHPPFPFALETMLISSLFSGKNAVTEGPVKQIEKLKKPALFLHSRKDEFSLPDASEEMYARCGSEHETVWFEEGAHSRLRITDPERYDGAIRSFLERRNAE